MVKLTALLAVVFLLAPLLGIEMPAMAGWGLRSDVKVDGLGTTKFVLSP